MAGHQKELAQLESTPKLPPIIPGEQINTNASFVGVLYIFRLDLIPTRIFFQMVLPVIVHSLLLLLQQLTAKLSRRPALRGLCPCLRGEGDRVR